VIGSGGVLRHAPPRRPRRFSQRSPAIMPVAGRPPGAGLRVDATYVLAPAGLLAAEHPDAANALLSRHLVNGNRLTRHG
jgi:hypothetical protein